MKIVVSYINSIFNERKTIELINESIADGIHVDLMDGLYVSNKNFEITELSSLFVNVTKPLDIHLMTLKPSQYFKELFKLRPQCIYIHPKTENNPFNVWTYLKDNNIEPGLVINPDEEIDNFVQYFGYIKRVLLMSVYPGAGGQTFLQDTPDRLEILLNYQKKYHFEIFVDGGINLKTIKLVQQADGIVSGSFVCKSNNFNIQLLELQKCLDKNK